MDEIIRNELKAIEKEYNVRILLAIESGSRSWGFASSDSDYDVRFIYVRKMKDYLKLEKTRDVIELPIKDNLDINGWDLSKALKLLKKSNPTLIEWFNSKIINYEDTTFKEKFRKLIPKCFDKKTCLYHYLNMAKNSYKLYLQKDNPKIKKYFYALRSILACKYILEFNTEPPILFIDLIHSELNDELKPIVQNLLKLKSSNNEIKTIPRNETLNKYIETNIEYISNQLKSIKETNGSDFIELNNFFLTIIE